MTLKRVTKYLPTQHEVTSGSFLLLFGMLFMTGATIGIKVSEETEWMLITLPMLDIWVCWVIVWIGFETLLFKGKATIFIIGKVNSSVVMPVLVAILGDSQIEKIARKLNRFIKEDKGE